MKRYLGFGLLFAALFALGVACGDDSTSTPAATATTAASQTATGTQTATATLPATGTSTATESATATGTATPAETPSEAVTLRLGYFANITHAQPLVGLQNGIFAEDLGSNVTVETATFDAGPAEIEALFAGEIDIGYIGPNPSISGYVQSEGEALRIIAGATSGGALFIVRPEAGIEKPEDLHGKKLATPQLGNTQDVALRQWLLDNGLASIENGGDVEILPTKNADTLTLFQSGEIDGAWVPEPWGTRLIQEAGGKLFLDEKSLWPDGKFVTTNVIVRKEFLDEHPDVVKAFLRANVDTTQWILDNPEEAKQLVNAAIEQITSKPLADETIDAAWANIEPTWDPIASSLFTGAKHAFDLGFLGDSEPDLSGIYSLDLLNEVLAEEGLPAVSAQ